MQQTTRHACPCCGGAGLEPGFAGLLACPACGHMLWPHPPDADGLAALYGSEYFHGDEYADYALEEAALTAGFRFRLAALLRVLERQRRINLLEIGCAYGYFLKLAINNFNFVLGLDLSPCAVDTTRARGCNALAGGLEALGRCQGPLPPSWDSICMWDTIEHLARPEETVARAAEILAPGGVLAITTGDAGSLLARLRGPRWRQIHPPTHLHYFTRPSLSALLRRHGLEIIHTSRPGVFRSLGGISHHLLGHRPGGARLNGLISRSRMARLPIYANTLDYLFVMARKPAL